MYLVALTRWGAALETELPTLSAWLGITAYDLRLRAAGALPVVLSVEQDGARAQARVAYLRQRGHGAIACASASVPAPTKHFVVREFAFGEAALRCVDGPGRSVEIPYPDVLALVRAVSISSAESTLVTTEKKFNMGRALMSGGLIRNEKVEKTTRTASEAREQVLYLFRRSSFEPLLLRELYLRYQGLGAALKPTTAQNFNQLIELLRARAPKALYDQRFVTQKRKVGISAVSGISADRKVDSSNSEENDLAAFMLVLAHVENQL